MLSIWDVTNTGYFFLSLPGLIKVLSKTIRCYLPNGESGPINRRTFSCTSVLQTIFEGIQMASEGFSV